MKSAWQTAVVLGVLTGLVSAAETQPALKDQKDKISYSIGLNIGGSLKQQPFEVNPDLVAAGLRDVLKGSKPLLTEAEAEAVLNTFQREMMAKQTAEASKAGDANQKVGEAFLAANKKKEGIKTTASGLQYKVVKVGTGPVPKATDTVSTHYRGTLIDGKEFDSSYKRNQPATFPVNGVIKGWTEALQLMPVGSKWQLFIPSDLAYGARGAGRDIGPNATLIFDIELLGIEK